MITCIIFSTLDNCHIILPIETFSFEITQLETKLVIMRLIHVHHSVN